MWPRPTFQHRPFSPPARWDRAVATDGDGARRLIYTGFLAGAEDLRLHYGVDGWQGPVRELAFRAGPEEHRPGRLAAAVDVPELDGHVAVDFAVRAGDTWDNNHGANFRLWSSFEPVDAHLHARHDGFDSLGADSLHAALASAGIHRGIVSWRSNHYVTHVLHRAPALRGLVWVRPHHPFLPEVRRLLRHGRVGLKMHPAVDGYDADDGRMDPYVRVAADHRVPVAIHSGPGGSDPDRIRRLAERHPEVTFVLYHTYLGPYEGRQRAVAHALDVANLVLETSWCRVDQIRWMLDQVGPARVIFGSDAAVDGSRHFTDRIVENVESYNEGLLRLIRELDPGDVRAVLRDNTCRIFGLPAEPPAS
jgi:predicted TIM-barrel fold metal-dependent hydrolase